jgi:hypothetical protein
MAGSLPSWQALQGGIAGQGSCPARRRQQLPEPFNARFQDARPQAIVGSATPRTRRDDLVRRAARRGVRDAQRRSLSCRALGVPWAGRTSAECGNDLFMG